MDKFKIDFLENKRFVNLTFLKEVKKRSGEIVLEPGETLYGIPSKEAICRIVNFSMQDKEYTFKEYLNKYLKEYENYRRRF